MANIFDQFDQEQIKDFGPELTDRLRNYGPIGERLRTPPLPERKPDPNAPALNIFDQFDVPPEDEDEIEARGALIPLGRTKGGDLVVAVPEFLKGPLETAAAILSGQKTTRDLTGKEMFELGALATPTSAGSSVRGGLNLTRVAKEVPLPEGAARDPSGRLRDVVGRFVPEPSEAPPGQEAVRAAEDIGVELPVGISSDSPTVQGLFQTGRQMPFMQSFVERSIENVTSGLEREVGRAAGARRGYKVRLDPETREVVGGRVERALDNFTRRAEAEVDKSFAQLRKTINPNKAIPLMPEVKAGLNNILVRRSEAGIEDAGKLKQVVNIMMKEGISFNSLQRARSDLSRAIDFDIRMGGGMEAGDLKTAYGLLTKQLQETVRATAKKTPEEAELLFKAANENFSRVIDDVSEVRNILGTRDPGALADFIVKKATARGDTQMLERISNFMTPKSWKALGSFAIQSLGRNRAGEFSPVIFFNNFNAMPTRAKNLLFGSKGTRSRRSIENIAIVSRRMKEFEKQRNTSNTGRAVMTALGLGGVGVGILVDPISVLSVALGSSAFVLLLSRRATAESMARWSRAYERLLRKPTGLTAESFRRSTSALANRISIELGAPRAAGQIAAAIDKAIVQTTADQDEGSLERPADERPIEIGP